MDLNELRQQPHLSISGINDYIECGLLYKLGRIDRLTPEFMPDTLLFGTAIHKTLEHYYANEIALTLLDINDLQTCFESHWKKQVSECVGGVRYSKDNNFESLLIKGKEMLEVWFKNLPKDNYRIVGIEKAFSFMIPGVPIPIIGAMDLVQEDDDGVIIITDHKTAAKAYAANQINHNQQLTVYQMAAKANGYADREIILKFDCFIKTKPPKFEQYYTTRTEADEKRMIPKIQSVWEGISKGVFIPNDLSWRCGNCRYQGACNDWFMKNAA